jgi:hypothetical protein
MSRFPSLEQDKRDEATFRRAAIFTVCILGAMVITFIAAIFFSKA